MSVPIERIDAPVAALAPGQYTVQTVSGRPALSCPLCGGIDELEQPIAESGAVAQAHRCLTATCVFFDRVNLIGWVP